MKTIQMKDGDLVIEKKTTSDGRPYDSWIFIDGIEALNQRIKNRLKLFANEWFYEPNEGTDWFHIFDKPFTLRKMETEIYKTLSKDMELDSIDEINITPDFKNRSIKIDITAKSGLEIIKINEEMQDQ